MRNCIIIILGPTAVGKTDFAETLAQQFPSEIVNADLGQFYTPLSIGTAKPDWRKSPTAQNLFDIINEPSLMTVTQYRDKAVKVFEEIWHRNAVPIVVGGSGFYIKSLFFPPQSGFTKKGDVSLYRAEEDRWQQLYEIDPERALRIHRNDLYRINRALDIYYATGKKASEQMPRYQPVGSFCFVYLNRDRDDLYARINQRTGSMLENGWITEVERLQHTAWEPFLKKKKLIGYDDILEYLDAGKVQREREQLIEVIAQKTRNYAKRQITFGNQLFGQLEKLLLDTADTRSSCVRFNLTSGKVELYINQLLKVIRSMHCFEKDRR